MPMRIWEQMYRLMNDGRLKIEKEKKRKPIQEEDLGEENKEFIEEIGEIRKNILGSDNDASCKEVVL